MGPGHSSLAVTPTATAKSGLLASADRHSSSREFVAGFESYVPLVIEGGGGRLVSAQRAGGPIERRYYDCAQRKRSTCCWNSLTDRVQRRWLIPFIAFEWIWDWTAYLLSRWSFLEVLDYLGRFSILVAVIFYFSESGNRIKQRHYQAWQVINTAQGKGGSGGRIRRSRS